MVVCVSKLWSSHKNVKARRLSTTGAYRVLRKHPRANQFGFGRSQRHVIALPRMSKDQSHCCEIVQAVLHLLFRDPTVGFGESETFCDVFIKREGPRLLAGV